MLYSYLPVFKKSFEKVKLIWEKGKVPRKHRLSEFIKIGFEHLDNVFI